MQHHSSADQEHPPPSPQVRKGLSAPPWYPGAHPPPPPSGTQVLHGVIGGSADSISKLLRSIHGCVSSLGLTTAENRKLIARERPRDILQVFWGCGLWGYGCESGVGGCELGVALWLRIEGWGLGVGGCDYPSTGVCHLSGLRQLRTGSSSHGRGRATFFRYAYGYGVIITSHGYELWVNRKAYRTREAARHSIVFFGYKKS
jgi:hypothetical protein